MKLVYLFLLLTISENIFSQEISTPIEKDTIYNIVDVDIKPECLGGNEKLFKYIGNNFKVPEEQNLNGKVIVSFIVEKDGSLSDIKIIQDVGFGTGAQLLELIKNYGKWKPGQKNGEIVRVLSQVPLTIKQHGR